MIDCLVLMHFVFKCALNITVLIYHEFCTYVHSIVFVNCFMNLVYELAHGISVLVA